jgi:hypothetical protein
LRDSTPLLEDVAERNTLYLYESLSRFIFDYLLLDHGFDVTSLADDIDECTVVYLFMTLYEYTYISLEINQ